MIGLLLLGCVGARGPLGGGDGADDSGADTAGSGGDTGGGDDTEGTESGEGRGGWFDFSGTRYDVAATSSTCAALDASWTLAGVGVDEAGDIASVGHALGTTPTDGATWANTTNPQPSADEAYFFLRLGGSIYGADEGELGAVVGGDVVTIGWTDVPVIDVQDPSRTGVSSGAVGCVLP